MYRSLLVHVDCYEDSRKRIELALGLARQHHASLIGLAAGLPRVPIESGANSLGAIATSIDFAVRGGEELEVEFERASALFAELTADSGVRTEWRTELDLPSLALAEAANAADLIVIGCCSASHQMVGDLLMRVGRPILAVPANIGALGERDIVVAWKSTREARRAVSDAMPLITRAQTVHIVHISEGNEPADDAVEDVRALLARHDIFANAKSLKHDGSIAEMLLAAARHTDADLIVAGGYGHSRLREWVLGGVTRSLLERSHIPCLMSH
jgi:nucleotide-binding universal stress UspA family protein